MEIIGPELSLKSRSSTGCSPGPILYSVSQLYAEATDWTKHHRFADPARCDPALVKAIARGRAWFDELVTGRVRSLQELAKRDGISRRYIRRLVGLAFLSPQLVEAILHGRQPAELTATRLTELDLPLNWAEQHRLLTT
jgi:hypothetical protein